MNKIKLDTELKRKASLDNYKRSITSGEFTGDVFDQHSPLNDYMFDQEMDAECTNKVGGGNNWSYQRQYNASAQCSCNSKVSYNYCRRGNKRRNELGLKEMQSIRQTACKKDSLAKATYRNLLGIHSDIKNAQKKFPNDITKFKAEAFSSIKKMCESSVYQAANYPLDTNYSAPRVELPGICFVTNSVMAKNLKLPGSESYVKSNFDEASVKNCVNYFTAQYDEQVTEYKVAKKNREERKKQKAQLAKQKEADLLAKLKKENQAKRKFEKRFELSIKTGELSFVLDKSNTSSHGDAQGIQELFYFGTTSYFTYLDQLNSQVFTPPVKGEFETTTEYKKRNKTELAKFNQSLLEKKRVLPKKLAEYLSESVGKVVVDSVLYDADSETFTIELTSVSGVHLISLKLATEAKDAQLIKKKLGESHPFMIFDYGKDLTTATLKRVVLAYRSKDPHSSQLFNPQHKKIELTLNKTQSKAWVTAYQEKKEAERLEREQKELAEKRQIAKQFPYIATLSCGYGRLVVCLGNDGSLSYRTSNRSVTLTPNELAQSSEYEFRLTKDFEIHAQNGGRRGQVLSLEIRDLVSGKVLYSESVSNPYERIKVQD
ncbi:hypothetical protein GCM10027050_21830 [Psychrosphaera aestuarii]